MGTKSAAVFLLAFSGYVIIGALRLDIGKVHQPGAGFIPFWSAISLGVLAIAIFFEKSKKAVTEKDGDKKLTNYKSIIIVLVALFAYTAVLEYLGFVLTTVIFVAILLRLIERKPWLVVGVTSLAMAFACYMVFKVWLQAELPQGIFFL